MKSFTRIFILVIFTALSCTSFAQVCVSPLQTIVYDTTFFGNGNATTPLSFPKFNPMSGTLMTVEVQTNVTLKYSFQLENTDVVPINNYRVRVNREDEISSIALMSPIYNAALRTYGPYALAANNGVMGSGPDYIARGPLYVLNNSSHTQQVYNTADYLGVGNVDFDYTTTTYSFVTGGVNNFFTGTAQDSVNVKVIYTYCPTWFLKADLTSFTAKKQSETSIDIQWVAENEAKDRVYELEKSYDGRHYESVKQQIADPNGNNRGAYRYAYYLQTSDNKQHRIIFRLKQKEKDGTIKYSELRMVDYAVKDDGTIKVYPNPAKSSTQIIFSNTTRGQWKVNLINRSGATVKQFNFNNALTGKMDGLDLLPKGNYILVVTEQKTGKTMRQQIVLQ